MTLKRVGKAAENQEPVMEDQKDKNSQDNQNKEFSYEEQQKNIQTVLNNVSNSVIDSNTPDDEDKGAAFLLDNDTLEESGMTLHPPDKFDSQGMTPANEVTVSPKQVRTSGNYEVMDTGRNQGTRPATRIDLSKLDESMILEIPDIKAATFELIGMLDPKPKDKSIRFRWANYKNNVQGNLARYYALGFTNATLDDIDQEKSPIDPSMIDGSTVKYYDIILLKIPVMRLMSLYKANIIKSVNRLVRHRERGLQEAKREFSNSLSGSDKRAYNNMKDALNKEPVEFFVPGAEDSQVVSR